jgi:two-component system chemotaxis response regulator CheY
MRVLVVDDSRIMRNIVKNSLINLGFDSEKFQEATNGSEAWSILQEEPFDLLLLDWNMPMLNGLELVKRIRRSPSLSELPIIMVTSEKAKYNVIEAVKSGVDDYIVKPLKEKALMEKISRVMGD